ncbi:MAG: hypothetical protein EBV86_05835 [Marivivens sp.]|nr:hypothetical protein [Marivivens sp.]
MNEQAIQQLYALAKQDGYKKSLNDFIELIHTNPNAFNQMYTLAKKDGYRKDKSEFATLVGTDATKPEFAHVFAPQAPLKKKEATESPSEDASLDSSSVDRAPELTQQQGFETVYSPEFTSEIDDELVSMDEEDAVKELRDRYSQYGLVFEEAGPGIDRITVRNADGSRSETFRFDPFTQAGIDQTKAQLSSFIRENAKGPQAPKFQDDLGKALHAKQSTNSKTKNRHSALPKATGSLPIRSTWRAISFSKTETSTTLRFVKRGGSTTLSLILLTSTTISPTSFCQKLPTR